MLLISCLCAVLVLLLEVSHLEAKGGKIKTTILSSEDSAYSALRSCQLVLAISTSEHQQLLTMALVSRTCLLVLRTCFWRLE